MPEEQAAQPDGGSLDEVDSAAGSFPILLLRGLQPVTRVAFAEPIIPHEALQGSRHLSAHVLRRNAGVEQNSNVGSR